MDIPNTKLNILKKPTPVDNPSGKEFGSAYARSRVRILYK